MALREAMKQRAPKTCKFAVIVASFDDEDRDTIVEWLSTNVSISAIAQAIKDDNPENAVTDSTILKHARGRCQCSEPDVTYGIVS